MNRLWCAGLLLVFGATGTAAQDRPPSDPVASSGVYVGAQLGVLGGSSLFHPYDLVDGSGSQFGGLSVGYRRRTASGLAFGGEADLSFGAEPAAGASAVERPEVFGGARARVGYQAGGWTVYGTGGPGWTRDRGWVPRALRVDARGRD